MATALLHSLKALTDSNGVPYSGALVYVYAAGTTTPLTVYSDSGLSATAANPVVCDSSGVCPLRYISAVSYKLTVTTSAGVSISNFSGDNLDPGVPIGAGALAVANGGTGATTAATARTNLDVPANSTMTTAQTDISTLQTRLGSTDRTRIAAGTTAQQPGSPAVGDIRYNSTSTQYEGYISAAWTKFLQSGTAIANAEMPSGSIVKSTYAEYTSSADVTAVIPADDTIPQVGEGTEIISTTFTPLSASNTLRFRFSSMYSNNGNDTIGTVALFKDAGANAVCAAGVSSENTGGSPVALDFVHHESAAAASAATWSVRFGVAATTGRLNGTATARLYGGVAQATLTIEEIKA